MNRLEGFVQNNFFLTFPRWILIYTGEILIIIIGERAGDSSSNVISLDPKLPLSFFTLTKIVCQKKRYALMKIKVNLHIDLIQLWQFHLLKL